MPNPNCQVTPLKENSELLKRSYCEDPNLKGFDLLRPFQELCRATPDLEVS